MDKSEEVDRIFNLDLREIDVDIWRKDEFNRFFLKSGFLNDPSSMDITFNLDKIIEVERGVQPYSRSKHTEEQISSDFLRHFGDSPPSQEFYPELLGEELSRYVISPKMKVWLKYSDQLASKREEKFFSQKRVVLRRLLSRRRELMSAVTSQKLITTDNILNILPVSKDFSPFFLSCLLNSRYIAWKYTQRSAISVKDDFPQVTYQELGRLPIRRIHFTTLVEQRKTLGREAQAVATKLVADVRGLPLERGAGGWPRFDTAAFRRSALGVLLNDLLPQDDTGAFLAFAEGATGAEERSDVVHDLLAALAEQMIDLNKQKQAEIKRFLGWLEAEFDIQPNKEGNTGIDSLKNKTKLQNYLGDYQKNEPEADWDTIYSVLYDNRRRFSNDTLLTQLFLPQLRTAYEASLATLRPLKAQLARTDALIDQIVYQLYGLTGDEVAVVEGRS